MSNCIRWVVEFDIRDGALENFKELMNDMVETVRANEPGALNYEWFISQDGTRCHVYEQYVDSAAVMTHVANFGRDDAERVLAVAERKRMMVYGDPSDEVIEALADFGAVHMKRLGGFAR